MATPQTDTLHALLALQQVDTQIQRATRARSALDNGTQAAADAAAARASAQGKRDSFHHLSGDLKDSELKLSALEAKRKSYEQKLYQGAVTNAKELASIEREIGALGRQRSDLDGRILELMEQVEQAQADLTVAEAQAASAEAHHQATVGAFQAKHERLTLELADATRARTDAAASVTDKALLARYDQLRAKNSGVGIARIDNATCGGCHMTLPSGLIRAVKETDDVQTCDNCGRLLTL